MYIYVSLYQTPTKRAATLLNCSSLRNSDAAEKPPNYISLTPSTKALSLRLRDGWRSLRRALASIWRMRSRVTRSEEHTSELQSLRHLVCRLLLETTTKTVPSDLYAQNHETGQGRLLAAERGRNRQTGRTADRKSTRLNSSHLGISYA